MKVKFSMGWEMDKVVSQIPQKEWSTKVNGSQEWSMDMGFCISRMDK
jgi:hypothetical protein